LSIFGLLDFLIFLLEKYSLLYLDFVARKSRQLF